MNDVFGFGCGAQKHEDGDLIMKGEKTGECEEERGFDGGAEDACGLNEEQFKNFEGCDDGVMGLNDVQTDGVLNNYSNAISDASVIKEAPENEEQTDKKLNRNKTQDKVTLTNCPKYRRKYKSTNNEEKSDLKLEFVINKRGRSMGNDVVGDSEEKGNDGGYSKEKCIKSLEDKKERLKSLEDVDKKYGCVPLDAELKNEGERVSDFECGKDCSCDENKEGVGAKKRRGRNKKKSLKKNKSKRVKCRKSSLSSNTFHSEDSSQSSDVNEVQNVELMDDETIKIYIKQYGIKGSGSIKRMKETLQNIMKFYESKELPKNIYGKLVNFTSEN